MSSEVGYWRAMHGMAKERADRLLEKNEALEAKVKLRERQLFGRKSESGGQGVARRAIELPMSVS